MPTQQACVRIGDFSVEPPTHEITTGWQGTLALPRDASTSAGRVWEGSGRRAGHQVSWRISGAELELCETTLLPGVALVGGELRLRFASSLLPPVGLSQLRDGSDSLLMSVAMHAPSGGVLVYQMVFELGADAAPVHGAVVRRASWFGADPTTALSTLDTVGEALGVPLCAAFAPAEATPAGWRTSLLLGGESDFAVHVSLLLDPRSGALSASSQPLHAHGQSLPMRILSSVAGSLPQGRRQKPADAICGVALVRARGDMCAVALSRGGALRLWRLDDAAAASEPLCVADLSDDAGGGAAGGGGGAGGATPSELLLLHGCMLAFYTTACWDA